MSEESSARRASTSDSTISAASERFDPIRNVTATRGGPTRPAVGLTPRDRADLLHRRGEPPRERVEVLEVDGHPPGEIRIAGSGRLSYIGPATGAFASSTMAMIEMNWSAWYGTPRTCDCSRWERSSRYTVLVESRRFSKAFETKRSVNSARSSAACSCMRPTVRWSSSRLTVYETRPSSATGRTPAASSTSQIFAANRMRRGIPLRRYVRRDLKRSALADPRGDFTPGGRICERGERADKPYTCRNVPHTAEGTESTGVGRSG